MKRFILVLAVMIFSFSGVAIGASAPKPAVSVTKGAHSYEYEVTRSFARGDVTVAFVKCVEKDHAGMVLETRNVRVTMATSDFSNDDLLVASCDKEWDKAVPTPRPTATPRVLHYTDN